eukprot:gene8753-62684_t
MRRGAALCVLCSVCARAIGRPRCGAVEQAAVLRNQARHLLWLVDDDGSTANCTGPTRRTCR